MTLIIRNAFGGAYASYNSHFVGADLVFAYPMARIAVMGPAGKDFVYKDEMRSAEAAYILRAKRSCFSVMCYQHGPN